MGDTMLSQYLRHTHIPADIHILDISWVQRVYDFWLYGYTDGSIPILVFETLGSWVTFPVTHRAEKSHFMMLNPYYSNPISKHFTDVFRNTQYTSVSAIS